jgi:peptidoglycan/LPS O-acetylase OafA/YrhL
MPHLDVLRFIASCGIVAYHFRTHLELGPAAQHVAGGFSGLKLFVDLFFAISGFVITRFYGGIGNKADYFGFLHKRIARLVPLHWATALFFVGVGIAATFGLVRPEHADNNYQFNRLIPNLLLMHAWFSRDQSFNYVSWSISAELAMYILFPAFLRLSRRDLAGWTALLALAGLSLLGDWWNWSTAARAQPSLLFGMWLFRHRAAVVLPWPRVCLAICILAFSTGCALNAPLPALLLVAYAIVACGVASDQHAPKQAALVLAPLGTLTYSMYMLHPVVEVLGITFIGKHLLKLSGMALNGWIVAMVPMVLIFSYGSYVLFEMPSRRFINGLGRRRPIRTPKTVV